MAVKMGKLWSNSKFSSLTNNSKLFYIYLSTSPDINSVGVCSLDIKVVSLQVSMTVYELRESMIELVDKDFILCDNIDGELFFTVLAHFNTLPKSDSTVLKVTRDLESLPSKLVKELSRLGISTDRKAVKFIEPTVQEVQDFALSKGYKIDAEGVIKYYRGQAEKRGKSGVWLDSMGKQVKDWRAKLRIVWFKDENKLKVLPNAPKGFESFYVEIDGKTIFPDAWKNGQPFSKNIGVNKKLKEEYEKRNN